MKILIVDPDPSMCASVCNYFEQHNVNAKACSRALPAINKVGLEDFEFVLIDRDLEDFSAERVGQAMDELHVPYAYMSRDRKQAEDCNETFYKNGAVETLFEAVMSKFGLATEAG
jgi:DNA-binding response OmpR family regulator